MESRFQNYQRQTLLAILICLPVLLAVLLPFSPRPHEEVQIVQRLYRAELLQHHEQAALQLVRLLEYHPELVNLWERLAFHEMASGNAASAAEYFKRAQESDVLSEEGMLAMGDALAESGNIKEAVEVWLLLGEQTGQASKYLPLLVERFQRLKRWDLATRMAQLWAEKDPKNTQAVWQAGVLLSYQNPEAAIELLTPLTARGGPEAGLANQLLKTLETARQNTQPAYQRVVIGQQLGELGYWEIAEQAFKEAVQLSPEYAEGWALLAEAQQNLGKDGYPSLRRAFELNPVSDLVQTAMALYWRRQNQPQIALAYLHVLAEKHPDEGRWYVEIGAALAQSGDLIEALRAYRRAVDIEPENAELWRALAVFSATNGFDPQSYTLPAAQRALDLDGNNPASLDTAGFVYMRLGKWEEAEQFLQQALKVNDAYAPALLHLGQVYLEMGRTSQAYQPLKKAADSKDELIALTAQRLLERYFPGEWPQP